MPIEETKFKKIFAETTGLNSAWKLIRLCRNRPFDLRVVRRRSILNSARSDDMLDGSEAGGLAFDEDGVAGCPVRIRFGVVEVVVESAAFRASDGGLDDKVGDGG